MDGRGGPRRGEWRNRRYGADFGRRDGPRGPLPGEGYEYGYGGAPYPLPPFVPPFAGMAWGWAPPMGWGAWAPGMSGFPFAPMPPGPPRREPPPLPPGRSPMYGRGGDEALRRWAGRYGYDLGYEIHPRPPRRRGYEW